MPQPSLEYLERMKDNYERSINVIQLMHDTFRVFGIHKTGIIQEILEEHKALKEIAG